MGKKQEYPRLEEQEIEIFSLLHQSGMPFMDNIALSFRQKDKILDLLNQGFNFSKLMQSQKGKHMKQLGTLMAYFSLDQAILYDGKLRKSREVMVKKLLRHSAYPLFLMAFSTGLIWFFSKAILPAFGEFSADSSLLDWLRFFTTAFWIGILGFSLFLGSVFILDGSKTKEYKVLFTISLVKVIASMECAALFECTQASSLSTYETLELIQKSTNFPFASLLTKRWKKQLQKGYSIAQCILEDIRLDPTFVRFFSLGLQGSIMAQMMSAYQKSALMILEKKVKRLSNWILYLAYGCVGILATSVYQMMLEPLMMLNSF